MKYLVVLLLKRLGEASEITCKINIMQDAGLNLKSKHLDNCWSRLGLAISQCPQVGLDLTQGGARLARTGSLPSNRAWVQERL